MLTSILAILSPIFNFFSNTFGQFFQTKQVQITEEASVTNTSIQTMGAVEQKWPFVAAIIPIMAMPYAIYMWKAIVWDKVVGPMLGYHDTTDLISGPLGIGFTIIIPALFLHSWITRNAT